MRPFPDLECVFFICAVMEVVGRDAREPRNTSGHGIRPGVSGTFGALLGVYELTPPAADQTAYRAFSTDKGNDHRPAVLSGPQPSNRGSQIGMRGPLKKHPVEKFWRVRKL
jgi:hypothetical protein